MNEIAKHALCCLALFAFSLPNVHVGGTGQKMAVLTIQLQPVLTTGLSSPLFLTSARDGSNRLFVVEQAGRIKVLQPGQTSPTVFLDITAKVLSGGERGLLGLAFHPQFSTNRRFFVYYTRQTDGAIVIAEYRVSIADPNVAGTSETVLLPIPHPNFGNHNGGMIAFGPDGFLYIGTGDGGSGNDPDNNGQNINALLGKILRIDVDHPNGAVPYSSPASNPFFGSTPGADEIFAYGMRNPWRFSFDRSSGQLYVADVGQGAWEEIDIVTNGGNYGWRVMEGNHCNPNLNGGVCTPIGIAPIAEYGHTGGRCSITGGYAYRGPISTLPAGAYVYGDYCTGEIFLLEGGTQSLLLDTALNISSFGEDEAGEIYVVGLGGTVHRIVNPNAPCSFFVSPSSRSFRAIGRAESLVVTAPVNCAWSAASNDSFITINAGNSGTGTGAVAYSVAPNISCASRNGTVTAGGLTHTVNQSGISAAPLLKADFDGDRKTDITIFRPVDGNWWIRNSTGGFRVQQWGYYGDKPVPGDYDGDGRTDVAIYRPAEGDWWILNSSGGFRLQQWGFPDDVLVPGDYDGDGRTDLAIYRPADGNWWILNSSGGFRVQQWGIPGDIIVPGDYDGDARTDMAIFRPADGNWWILQSSGGYRIQQWGFSSDIPVPGDYDGDGKTDVAIYRPSDGNWWILNSSGGYRIQQWGFPTDIPVPGDYDGDGKTDMAIYRPADGNWWILNSSGGYAIQQWGYPFDVPLPSAYGQ